MDEKIKELTEKIYREGVAKGEDKAREIISAAEAQAAAVVAGAEHEAERIVADAEKTAAELKRKIEADLTLSARQAMSALKQQLLDLLSCTVIDKPISAALSDPATMVEFLRIIMQNWKADSKEAPSLEVLLPESKREELAMALQQGLQDVMAHGLEVRFLKNIKAGFQVRMQGSSFKIGLTDEDFKEFFKEYLRPKTRTFLFG